MFTFHRFPDMGFTRKKKKKKSESWATFFSGFPLFQCPATPLQTPLLFFPICTNSSEMKDLVSEETLLWNEVISPVWIHINNIYLCTDFLELGMYAHIHWNSISSLPNIHYQLHNFQHRQLQNHWPSQVLGSPLALQTGCT